MTPAARLEAVRAVLERGGPLVIPDTCSLLDILRAPVRKEFLKEDGSAFARVLEAVEAATGATVVLVEQVGRELEENRQRVLDGTRGELRKTTAAVRDALDRMTWLGDPARHGVVHLHELGHPEMGYSLLNRLVAGMVVAPESGDARFAATERALRDVAPSRKGKQSLKDCLVVETAIRFVADCRDAGFDGPAVFLSANTDDYCEGKGLRLQRPLDREFASVRLTFEPRWAALHKHLRR